MTAFERWLLNLSVAISALTGLIYFVMKDLMKKTDPFSVLGHPWQPHVLSLHLLAGPLVIFALGLIYRTHVLERLRWGRPSQGRLTGLAIVGLAAPLVLTGYLLQIVTSATGRPILGWVHFVFGVLFGALFVGHLIATLVRRRPPARQTGRAAATLLGR